MPTVPQSYRAQSVQAALSAEAAKTDDYRALVCVFLFGGADTHYMIHPRRGANRAAYDAQRGPNAARFHNPTGSYRPEINGGGEYIGVPINDDWGAAPVMAPLFGAGSPGALGRIATMINVGFLKEPTTRATYLNRSVRLPEQLESHNTQQELWQALPAFVGMRDSGWMGRAGELAHAAFNVASVDNAGPVTSTSGRPLQVQGYEQDANVLLGATATGSVAINLSAGEDVGSSNWAALRDATRRDSPSDNRLHQLFVSRIQAAIRQQTVMAANLQPLTGPAEQEFVDRAVGALDSGAYNSLANQFRTVLRMINARAALGHKRGLFFVALGGWDHHVGLMTNAQNRFDALARSMRAFYDATGDIGLQQNVVTFTASEFNRTLVINGSDGSDHAWGGHMIVMGGAVNGGVYGSIDMTLGAGDDYTTSGRYIPSTSVEQMIDPMLRWYGVPSELVSLVLPNVDRFPRNTIELINAPQPATPNPAIRVNFMAEYDKTYPELPSSVTFTPGIGPFTRFNAAGEMEVPPHNLAVSTDMSGARLGVIGSGGALPTGWNWNAPAGNMTREVVGLGQLSDGTPYIDLRLSGTVTGITYPHLSFGPSFLASGRMPWGLQLYLQLLNGSQIQGNLRALIPDFQSFTSGNSYVANHDGVLALEEYARYNAGNLMLLRHAAQANNSNIGLAQAQLSFVIGTAGQTTTHDLVFRVARPHAFMHIGPSQHHLLDVDVPFVPNPTATPRYPIPLDHDPVTLRRRGLSVLSSRTNRLYQTVFTRNGVRPGTVGALDAINQPVWPTAWSVVANGMNANDATFQLVETGVERGMSYMDVRVFGRNSAAGNGELRIHPTALTVGATGAVTASGATTNVTFSTYLSLRAGRLPVSGVANGHALGLAVRDSSNVLCAVQGSLSSIAAGSMGNLAALRSAPISHQRFALSLQNPGADAAIVTAQIGFGVAAGESFDFTVRIAAPQLEDGQGASAFMPTYGLSAYTSSGPRNSHRYSIGSAAFAQLYGAATVSGAEGASIAMKFTVGMSHAGPNDASPNLLLLRNSASESVNFMALGLNSVGAAGTVRLEGRNSAASTTPNQNMAVLHTGATTLPFGTRVSAAVAVDNVSGTVAARGAVMPADTTTTIGSGLNSVVIGPGGVPDNDVYVEEFAVYRGKLTDDQLAAVTGQ